MYTNKNKKEMHQWVKYVQYLHSRGMKGFSVHIQIEFIYNWTSCQTKIIPTDEQGVFCQQQVKWAQLCQL